MPTFAACGYLAEKDDVASFNLRASCRKLLIISKQQHQIETGGAARRGGRRSRAAIVAKKWRSNFA